MLHAAIRGTHTVLAGDLHETEALSREAMPDRDPDEIRRRTGIATRRWVAPATTAVAVAAEAVAGACEDAGMEPAELRRIVFVTSTGGDVLIPANVNGVINRLGVDHLCDGFDLNNACMGFLSAMDVAARSVHTGVGPIAVVVVEQLSRYLDPAEPRPYMVLADACAAVVLDRSRGGEAVLGTRFGNDGARRGSVFLEHPGVHREPRLIEFAASNRDLRESAVETLQRCADDVLSQAGLTLDQVDWVLPHQPNGNMLRVIVDSMGVAPERLVPVVEEIGSVGAAAIAVSLDRLRRTRPIRPGQHVLMVGVGAGMAYGAMLFRV